VVKADSNFHLYLRIILVSALVAALGLFPSIRDFNTLLQNAHQAAASGDWSGAADYLTEAANRYPWRDDLKIQAARYAFQAGDPKAVIAYLESRGAKAGMSQQDALMLGDAYLQNGDLVKAVNTWKQLDDSSDSADALQRLADLYLQEKDYPSALSYLKKLLSLDPSDGGLYYQIGLLYAVSEPLQSLPYLAQAADIDPSLADQAHSLYEKIQTANLFDRPAYTLLAAGRELANQGEWSLAGEAFKRVTEIDPDYADGWAFLGEAKQQVKQGETGTFSEVGLAELEHALQLDASSVLANTFMGIYWERQQDYSQAQTYLQQAITLNPDDPYLYSELGNILSRAGDLPAAQSAFESAISHAPQDPTFYRLLAQFALDNGIQTHEIALASARQALKLNPQDPASLDMMAQVMLELRDFRSAEDYSIQALSIDQGYTPAALHLGTAYLYLGEPDLAYHWLRLARDNGQGSWVGNQASRMLDYYFP